MEASLPLNQDQDCAPSILNDESKTQIDVKKVEEIDNSQKRDRFSTEERRRPGGSKDQLRFQNMEYCRLCGFGGVEESSTETNDAGAAAILPFLSIFEEKLHPDSRDTLDVIVNRYIPNVLVSQSHFDKVNARKICSICYESLKIVVGFVEKVWEGQKLLAKLAGLNGKVVAETCQGSKSAETETPDPKVATEKASGKKRGRPRKDEAKPNEWNNSIVLEPRSKRQSRPPIRYTNDVSALIEPCDIKAEDGVDVKINSEVLSSSSTAKEKLGTGEDVSNSIPHPSGVELPSKDRDNVDGQGASDHKSDSDVSVKLSDLIGNRKKIVRRRKRKGVFKKALHKLHCDKCAKSFNHQSSLAYHISSTHGDKNKYICSTCGRGFCHKQLLNTHMSVHGDEKRYCCDRCDSKFKSRASLYTHKKSVHAAVREFTCEKCGFQFNLKSSLTVHLRIHTGEKPFKCQDCSKAFAQRSSFREHCRTHTGEKPYSCVLCSKAYKTASQLRGHKFSHSLEKAHLCQICGKVFNQAESFKFHMRRHNDEKPLECSVCKKQFAEPTGLKKHYRMHTGEKPYQCALCSKVFSDSSNFARHKKTHNSPSSPSSLRQNSSSNETQSEKSLINLRKTEIQAEKANEGTSNSIDLNQPSCSKSRKSLLVSKTPPVLTTEHAEVVEILKAEPEVELEQVIYIYSGDGPIFTFPMTEEDNHESSGPSTGESSANIMSAEEGESHYYSLETVNGTTVAVPITMRLQNSDKIENASNLVVDGSTSVSNSQ